MGPSFQEKSVWIQLLGTVVCLGAYFVIAGRMLREGVTALPAYVALFTTAVVLMVVILIVGHILAAIGSRRELEAGMEDDERDRLIRWRAESNSEWLLAMGVLAAVTFLVLEVPPVWIAHTLLLSLFGSTILGYGLRLAYYRRGTGGV